MILYKYKQLPAISSKDSPEEEQRKKEERNRLSEILIDNKIFYTGPNQLNDPFEFKSYFTTPTDISKLTEMCKIHIKKFEPNYNQLSEKDKVEKRKETFKYFRNEEQINKDYREHISKHFGVFCVSTKHNSPIMWAHYAGESTGLCIGFKPELIDKGIGIKKDMEFGIFDKVKYTDKFPTINIDVIYQNFKNNGDGNIEKLQIACFTKSKEWKYEREYRFLQKITDDSRKHNFHLIKIKLLKL